MQHSFVWLFLYNFSAFLRGKTGEQSNLPEWIGVEDSVNQARQELQKQLGSKDRFAKPTKVIALATVLDTGYKNLSFLETPVEKKSIVDSLLSSLIRNKEKTPDQQSAAKAIPKNSAKPLFNIMAQQKSAENKQDKEAEISSYLSMHVASNVNTLEWGKQ